MEGGVDIAGSTLQPIIHALLGHQGEDGGALLRGREPSLALLKVGALGGDETEPRQHCGNVPVTERMHRETCDPGARSGGCLIDLLECSRRCIANAAGTDDQIRASKSVTITLGQRLYLQISCHRRFYQADITGVTQCTTAGIETHELEVFSPLLMREEGLVILKAMGRQRSILQGVGGIEVVQGEPGTEQSCVEPVGCTHINDPKRSTWPLAAQILDDPFEYRPGTVTDHVVESEMGLVVGMRPGLVIGRREIVFGWPQS